MSRLVKSLKIVIIAAVVIEQGWLLRQLIHEWQVDVDYKNENIIFLLCVCLVVSWINAGVVLNRGGPMPIDDLTLLAWASASALLSHFGIFYPFWVVVNVSMVGWLELPVLAVLFLFGIALPPVVLLLVMRGRYGASSSWEGRRLSRRIWRCRTSPKSSHRE